MLWAYPSVFFFVSILMLGVINMIAKNQAKHLVGKPQTSSSAFKDVSLRRKHKSSRAIYLQQVLRTNTLFKSQTYQEDHSANLFISDTDATGDPSPKDGYGSLLEEFIM